MSGSVRGGIGGIVSTFRKCGVSWGGGIVKGFVSEPPPKADGVAALGCERPELGHVIQIEVKDRQVRSAGTLQMSLDPGKFRHVPAHPGRTPVIQVSCSRSAGLPGKCSRPETPRSRGSGAQRASGKYEGDELEPVKAPKH